MPEDAQPTLPPTDATSQPAATMLEPDYHPFAEELGLTGRQPEPGASAPDAEPVPEATEQPTAASEQSTESEPQDEIDFKAEYAKLQQRIEEMERNRKDELSQYEVQQKEWLEHQQRENERKAEEARKRAEQDYKTRLKAAYDRAVSADDDETGQQILDEFIRNDIAAQLAQHFNQQIESEREQYQTQLQQYQQEAEAYVANAFKPGFAHKLATDNGLPDEAVQILMSVPVDQMEAKAVEIKTLLAQVTPQVQQQVVQQKVDERRASGVHAVGGVSGGPLPPRELRPMAADSTEAVQIARALFDL